MTDRYLANSMTSALDAVRLGDSPAALQSLDQILGEAPEHVPALILKARLLRQRGALDAAAELLEQARPFASGQPQWMGEMGYLALSRGDASAAVEAFDALLEMHPDFADGHFNLAQALQLQGHVESAIVHLERALDLDVERPHEARVELGYAMLQRRREEDALVQFELALAEQPDYARAMLGAGMVHASLGDFEQAIHLFRSALDADPRMLEALQHISEHRHFDSVDDPDLAALRAALDGDLPVFQREKLSFALAKALDDCGEYEQAWRLYEQANAFKRNRSIRYNATAFDARVQRVIKLYSDRFSVARRAVRDDNAPVVIVGMPRSGTTLIELMLARHPDIDSAGELDYFDRVVRGALAPYPDGIQHVDGSQLLNLSSGYLEELRTHGDAKHVTDKYPANIVHLGTIHTLLPNATIIHCRRHPLDTCLSIYFQDFPAGNHYADSLDDIAHYYQQYETLMSHWRDWLGDSLVEVQYEDVVDDAEAQLRRLLGKIGVDYNARCLDPQFDPAVVATLSRWQVRQPVYSTSVERWRNYRSFIEPLAAALDIEL